MSKAVDMLLDIASEKNGFSIGEPWRFSEFSLAAIVPILRQDEHIRAYRLMSEVGTDIKITDTGSINQMDIENRSSWPILLKSGELVVGATQERVITGSQVLMQGEKARVGCACVHATKGIRAGQRVKSGGYSPTDLRSVLYDNWRPNPSPGPRFTTRPNVMTQPEIPFVNYQYDRGLQDRVWCSVKACSASNAMSGQRLSRNVSHLSAAMPEFDADEAQRAGRSWRAGADDLASRITENREKFASVLKSVPLFDHQSGIVLLTVNGLESLDAFDNPESWNALRESFLQAEAGKVSDTSDQDNVFQFRKEKAVEAIRMLLTGQFEEAISVNKADTQTFIMTASKFSGEVVTLYERPIHCAFVKKA